MLKSNEFRPVARTNLECKKFIVPNTACVLSANIQENWPIFLVKEVIALEVSLFICLWVLIIEMINKIVKLLFREVLGGNVRRKRVHDGVSVAHCS